MTDDLNNKLLVCYSDHGLNNKLLVPYSGHGLNKGQTQPIRVYSPRKLIFNVYSPPTFSVILQYNSVILQSQIRSSLFGHLNNPHLLFRSQCIQLVNVVTVMPVQTVSS